MKFVAMLLLTAGVSVVAGQLARCMLCGAEEVCV